MSSASSRAAAGTSAAEGARLRVGASSQAGFRLLRQAALAWWRDDAPHLGAALSYYTVFSKRGGEHERTIREFRLKTGGIRVGEPLRDFRGVLTGVPFYEGSPGSGGHDRH